MNFADEIVDLMALPLTHERWVKVLSENVYTIKDLGSCYQYYFPVKCFDMYTDRLGWIATTAFVANQFLENDLPFGLKYNFHVSDIVNTLGPPEKISNPAPIYANIFSVMSYNLRTDQARFLLSIWYFQVDERFNHVAVMRFKP
jgi:hypothetical protein